MAWSEVQWNGWDVGFPGGMESGPFVGVGAEAGDLAGMGKREELKGAAADDEGVKSAVGGGGLAIIGEAGLGAEVGGKPAQGLIAEGDQERGLRGYEFSEDLEAAAVVGQDGRDTGPVGDGQALATEGGFLARIHVAVRDEVAEPGVGAGEAEGRENAFVECPAGGSV